MHGPTAVQRDGYALTSACRRSVQVLPDRYVWNGSNYAPSLGVSAWNGTAWVMVLGVYIWNGSTWALAP